jgi:hypothetical protein
MADLSPQTPGFVDPDRIYSQPAWYRDSGISKSRTREAGLMGHRLPTIAIGRRRFVHGKSGIEWMLKLAEIMGPSTSK